LLAVQVAVPHLPRELATIHIDLKDGATGGRKRLTIILRWLKASERPFNWFDSLRASSLTLVEFHAVCGDKDLRWETTEPWTPYDGVAVVYGNNSPVVYDTIYPKQAKS
jgi:hypothetical protein